MFLHLGGDVIVPLHQVIAIFDHEQVAQSRPTEDFLRVAKDAGRLLDVSGGQPKSFVLTNERVYLSQISSQTLMKRAENMPEYLEELSREG
ncbi:MAG TPA: DUF370 domain-containing protein [Firmicutes bacterium]|nr:DUF370 domain-containing protein [Bacillota bacterium]